MQEYNKNHIPLARQLRKDMTPDERKLWHRFLKTYPVRFRRQKTIGNYIVDFYCAKAKLVVEIDGSQHFLDDGLQQDGQRTEYLQTLGLQVVRISNRQIRQDFSSVCYYIDRWVQKRLSTPSPKEVSL